LKTLFTQVPSENTSQHSFAILAAVTASNSVVFADSVCLIISIIIINLRKNIATAVKSSNKN